MADKIITLSNLQTFKTKADTFYYKRTDTVANATTAATAKAVAWENVSGKPSLATLDGTGKIPASQLPSYVDDVLEFENKAAFPQTGEDGKIYIDEKTNLTYRWSGTAYVQISSSLALGETASTAYPGDKGKANATDIANIKSGATVVGKATADANGSDINATYAKKVELSSTTSMAQSAYSGVTGINNGTIVVPKAKADKDGNDIGATYAKKSEIPTLPTIDSELSSTSTNAVQNKVINTALTAIRTNLSGVAETADGIVSGTYTAKKAECDASGNVISTIYAKKTDIPAAPTVDQRLDSSSTNAIANKAVYERCNEIDMAVTGNTSFINKIADGTTVVGKAKADANGNNIANTYATKSSLSSYVQTSDLTYASESDITAMFT